MEARLMNLIYEGVDITKSIAINRCEAETYAENKADQLVIRFSDAASKWDSWRPAPGDVVQFKDDTADTGKMFITSLTPENGLFTVRASAMPPTGENINSQSWENVRLFQLCADTAKKHGLTLKVYNVTDQLYPYIQQTRLTDFAFLNRLLQLEGCAMIIYDGALVIYDEHTRESSPATELLKVGLDGRFTYTDNSAQSYGSVELVSGKFRGVFSDANASAARILKPTQQIDCTSDAEAQRFARGLLRQANKNAYTGSLRRSLTTNYAAASVLNLQTVKAGSWDGKIFVTQTRSDFIKGESKIFFRRPLEGY